MATSRTACLLTTIVVALGLVPVRAQEPALRIFLRGGPKTHGPAGNGLHDATVWVNEWLPLLRSRGATVEGATRFPTAAELDRTDVLVMFAADAGTILGDDRANLEAFLRRGGGIVCFHDCVVTSQDPGWFETIVGGSWENGVARYFEGENTYYYVSPEHPIVKGATNFRLEDEVYWNLHLMPDIRVLAASMQPVRPGRGQPAPDPDAIGTLIPQMWTYERTIDGGTPYRAFVSLLGHHFTTFADSHVRGILLRGIAWAGRRRVDLLTTPAEETALGSPAAR
jgi:type 1 glutamine amidotransferase